MMRVIVMLVVVGLAAGCSSTKESTAGTGGEKAAAPTAKKAPMETATVTLDPERIAVDEAAGTVTLKPQDNVRRASYTTWVFDMASYKKVIRGALDKPTAVKVEVTAKKTKTHKPDPSMPQPDGGFRYITKHARVIGLAN